MVEFSFSSSFFKNQIVSPGRMKKVFLPLWLLKLRAKMHAWKLTLCDVTTGRVHLTVLCNLQV